MTEKSDHNTRLGKLRNWLMGHLIQDVPDDLAVCEFDCRKPQCTQGDWENCQRRLQYCAIARRQGR
jgi:hypothetical protein